MTRWAAKVDANQGAIVRALRSAGHQVYLTHRLGGGFPDILVRTKSKRLVQMEIKMPGEPLTPAEEDYVRDFPETWIVESVAEALAACRLR